MSKIILDSRAISLTINRLAEQIKEHHADLADTVLIGLQPRGVHFAEALVQVLMNDVPNVREKFGLLDITFYRDDVRTERHLANQTKINFTIEGKTIILIDDVLFTGRTIRSAFDALVDYGRPAKVELCVLIDRRFSREFPIQPTYVGKSIDSFGNQKVKVQWQPAEVELI
jgi:pyrimidine operon attenuation protein / uracil phosphoribosyltransferase